ncbi:MAG: HEAT repeat domain-containing protein [Vicinamibacteria bacterium]
MSRHDSTPIEGTRADEVLVDGSAVATQADGIGDVSCGVNLQRDGDLTTFDMGSGIINSQADFLAVLALPGYVKVVNQINWCGGFAPGIIGCAPVPGSSMVVVRFRPAQEGILWLHEFCHTKGRSHRNDENAVMFPSIGDNRRQLNAAECDALEAVAAMTASPPSATGELMAQTALPDIGDFVRQTYFHGVPFEVAARYEPAVVPQLLDMLSNSSDEPYWSNVVTVLGAVGDESVVDPLVSFIEEGDATLSADAYNAKTAAILALGYLANRTGSQRALDYLIGGLQPTSWSARELPWTGPFQDAQGQSLQLSQMNIIALALSGREPALAALQNLRATSTRGVEPQIDSLLDEAIEAHATIDTDGLATYSRTVSSGDPL